MIIRLSKKKLFRFLTVITAALTIFGHSFSYHPAVHASSQIPLEQLPQGVEGSNTIDIRSTSKNPSTAAQPAFRTLCNFSHMSYDDPIVFPNQVGATHLHTFFGNTTTDANSTYRSLSTSGNSTCKGGVADRSAYWVPTLLDANDKPLIPSKTLIYYKLFLSNTVKDVPNGLKILTGNSKATSPQDINRVYWECRNSSNKSVAKAASIPVCQAGNTLQHEIVFPSCWDGFNLDASDHKSHMAFPNNGICPSSHPVKIPDISFKMIWNIPSGSTAGWRLSSDMYASNLPGGYSAHADFMEAWKPEVRKVWYNTCLVGRVDCHVGLLGDGKELYINRS